MQAHRNKLVLLYALVAVFIAISSYQFGVYSYQTNLWPFDLPPKQITAPVLPQKATSSPPIADHDIGSHDEFGRLTGYPGKEEVKCPKQNRDTAVILAIGQSNSANHGEEKFSTQYAERVLNYFKGKCYIASSPLLGATGEEGEFITPLADRLVQSGTYKSVIIISSGIGGSPISRWQRDGDLNEMLQTTIYNMRGKYRITEVIWHQGENDYVDHTSAKNYVKSFNSLLKTLSANKIDAPVFISIATKCGGPVGAWKKENPTANGQRQLVDNKRVFLGADTDTELKFIDRRSDKCHFRESGQLKAAKSFATAIQKYRESKSPNSQLSSS
jgi:hypothetical protein